MSQKKPSLFGETLRTVIVAVAIAFLIRVFAYEPFNIPSGSMKPTLLVGDYLFVSKFSYGYSRYSLPLGVPLIGDRILAEDTDKELVKRVQKGGDSMGRGCKAPLPGRLHRFPLRVYVQRQRVAVALCRPDLVLARDDKAKARHAFDALVGRRHKGRTAECRWIERQRAESRH